MPSDADDYDTILVAGPNGYGSTSYRSIDRDQLLRDVEGTLTPALQAFKQANGGKSPTDSGQLQPYITAEQQQAAFQRLMQLKDRTSGEAQNSASQTKP